MGRTDWGLKVRRIEQQLLFLALDHPRAVSEFLYSLKDGMRRGYTEFTLTFHLTNRRAFPNACTPIAGLLAHYSQSGVGFCTSDVPDIVQHTNMLSPLRACENASALSRAPLNKVWRFDNSEEINCLVDGFVQEVSQRAVCHTGVIEGLTWCLNEVMDNVMQHSCISRGYVMGQIHPTTKHIAFCVFDAGQGIYNSLKNSRHAPRNPTDAITLAVKEGVTRDITIGQGNGMWGLHNIVTANSGMLVVTSDSASYMVRGNDINTYPRIPTISRDLGTTTVDFQIDFEKGISLAKALGGHAPVNLRLEGFEDEKGNIVYRLAEESSGTGTRQSGERIRNELINIYNQAKRVTEIDFAGISVISSSFADELVGKLVAEYGFFGFTQIFRLKNMNEIVQSVVNRSVSQRMASTFAPDKFSK